MKNIMIILFRILVALSICFGFFYGITENVHALETCTWNGFDDANWHNSANWSNCLDGDLNPKEPGATDSVIVGDGSPHDPYLDIYHDNISVGSLEIQAAGVLTIAENVNLSAGQITNNGTIQITEETGNGVHIYAPFNNNGVVTLSSEGFMALHQSGNHSGSFSGKYLSFPDAVDAQENVFDSDSSVNLTNILFADNRITNFSGSFNINGNLYMNGTNAVTTVSSSKLISLGNVTINDGQLIVEMDGGSFNANGTLSIPLGSDLTGTGSIEGNLDNAGTVSPGNSPGIISINGDFTQQSTGILEIELAGTTAGTEFDQLQISGTASLDGSLNVQLIDEFSPQAGQSFSLITYTTLNGQFAEANLPDLGEDLIFHLEYRSDSVVLSVVSTSGTINGTVTYTGSLSTTHEIIVALHAAVGSSPFESKHIFSGDNYQFTLVPDGTYFISAFLDVNDSGDGPPDPDEPTGWVVDQDGNPLAIVIFNGNTIDDADIILSGPDYEVFLPLLLR